MSFAQTNTEHEYKWMYRKCWLANNGHTYQKYLGRFFFHISIQESSNLDIYTPYIEKANKLMHLDICKIYPILFISIRHHWAEKKDLPHEQVPEIQKRYAWLKTEKKNHNTKSQFFDRNFKRESTYTNNLTTVLLTDPCKGGKKRCSTPSIHEMGSRWHPPFSVQHVCFSFSPGGCERSNYLAETTYSMKNGMQ